MKIPESRAACKTMVPFSQVTLRPSIVKVICGMSVRSRGDHRQRLPDVHGLHVGLHGAAMLGQVPVELWTELRQVALDRPAEGLGEDADRLPDRAVGEVEERLRVLGAAVA